MDTGEIKNHDFEDKDIYVMFSDGVSDNLYVDSPYFKSCINKYLD
jgi:serine/threonine protein phosphatase PrpC